MWSNKEEDLQLIAAEELGGDIGEFEFTNVIYFDPSDRELYEFVNTPRGGYLYLHVECNFTWIQNTSGRFVAIVEIDKNGYMTSHRVQMIHVS